MSSRLPQTLRLPFRLVRTLPRVRLSSTMLSGASTSIRRLISQRRPQNGYGDGYYAGTNTPAHKEGRKDNGTPTRRPYSRKRSPPPIIISREQSIHDILNPLPPLPHERPRSSTSSLNSSERHAETYSTHSIDRSRSPLCSISSKGGESQESLQLSTTSYEDEDFPPQPPPKGYTWPRETPTRLAEPPVTTLEIINALSLDLDDEATPTQPHPRRQTSFSSYSENIQQLIEEADEAFRAVGDALAEVQRTETTTTFKELPRLPTPDPEPELPARELTPEPATPPLKSQIQDSPKQVTSSPRQITSSPGQITSSPRQITSSPRQITSSPRQTPISPIPSPATSVTASPAASPKRNISAPGRVKRKKSKKSKKTKPMMPHRKPAAAKSAAKSGPIWTLPDNVTELFSGKLFHRLEVDEMLTPSQLEEYRLQRMSGTHPERSTETLDAEASDTPIEPFHLEDLPSRIGSAGIRLNDDIPVERKPAAPSSSSIMRQDFSVEESRDVNSFTNTDSWIDIDEPPMQYKDTHFPTPPLRHGPRFTLRAPRIALPSIPEMATISTPVSEPVFRASLQSPQDVVADSNYVFLRSSPCSLTVPTFRHGPIRLAKADLVPDMKVGADEGLDWTAFQMAISGGAGDWLSESDDVIRRREAEEVEEISAWWDTWNFDSAGGLMTQDVKAASPTSTTSSEDYSDASNGETEKDDQYSLHRQWQQFRRRVAAENRQLELDMAGLQLDTSKLNGGEQLDRLSKDYSCRESYASLPQSPMLDLRVIRSEDGEDFDVVPMGYNLGHDLGDFLKWEAEHAYAGDFQRL
ncbi:hypothetical protein GGS23DRAFT_561803 [Durotheca rogersii]|uniref:uncharacterized protein n=1 Tax=Durotheca rogersii TaxID=419775 RepID=UPI002220FBB7|nr:uncharacterized protein GGS23DRAFT_561803 [Durotheca rogersii]KAI5864780.1 hypothetical protein GGS23DRAFT_561803 [Durotheca rogersii]